MAMAIKVFLSLLVFLASTDLSFSLYEDQVGLMDWHQQYIGKLKHAVFHSQKTSRKRVVVSTHENVLASIGLRHGEIFWRHALGTNDAIDELDISFGKYVITLSSNGTLLRAWNLPDGQLAWESFLQGTKPSKSILHVPASMKVDKDNVILIYSNGFLLAVSGIDGEVLWRKDLVSDSTEVQHIFQSPQGNVVYALGLVGSTKFSLLHLDARTGDLLKQNNAEFPDGFFGEILSLSSNLFVILDGSRSNIVTISLQHGEVSYQQTLISTLVKYSSGKAVLLPSKLAGMFAVKLGSFTIVIKVIGGARLEVVGRLENVAAISDALSISDNHHAIAIVQHGDGKIQLTVKHGHDWGNDLLKESIVIGHNRGNVEKVFINNYIRTDRSHGFRTLISMEDHSLLLVQQGEIVWSREDGLASVVDVTTSELPFQKHGVSVVKVEQNLFEWLNGHLLKLKGTLMLAGPDDVAAIQAMTRRSSGKSKMTRDHNGFRKLLIVLTKAGKVFALHTGDGHIVWSVLLQSTRKSDTCMHPTAVNIYQWQIPHHHAMDENPSVLIVGRCGPSLAAPAAISFVDTYTGMEFKSEGLVHSIAQVIPLPFTDSTEQRLHLLVDVNQQGYLYPKTQEARRILTDELPNVYWYSVDADNGIIKGHALKSNCFHEAMEEFCFEFRHLWSIVFPSESEKIITTVARKSNEVVHTQAKVTSDQDVMYKYISKNLLFVATVSPKAVGEIGTATPEEASLVVYVIDTVTGRILHRMIHHGCKGPVHAVFSENWIVYHYFNVRAHRFEMSVLEIYDQSRAENKEVWKIVLGKHNLTSPISLYSRPEVITKSQTYFFTHSVKAMAVTSTAKGITSKQLLIGTIGDQVLALDKRYLDPRRSVNPSQTEREEGIIPLTDLLPIIPQAYVTHSLRVEGLRGILTVPAKLESTSLVFAYGVDLFFTRIAPSRTYDSLTEDFSYALLLITIVALIAAIFATWILSERKELQDKWR